MNDRVKQIDQRLRSALSPRELQVVDDSAAHAGHPGARESGGGHFNVVIVSDSFVGKTLLERHRLVYDAVRDMMPREIHALSIKALTPDELPSTS